MQERTLSSAWTFWTKFLFPAIWILAFGYVTFLWSGAPPQTKFVFLVVWIAGTTSILWAYAGLKRVRMDERQLYVSNYFRETYVPFSAIKQGPSYILATEVANMNGNRYYGVRVEGAKYGVGFGSALAITISYTANHSILWAIIHGILGWLYVIYFALFWS